MRWSAAYCHEEKGTMVLHALICCRISRLLYNITRKKGSLFVRVAFAGRRVRIWELHNDQVEFYHQPDPIVKSWI